VRSQSRSAGIYSIGAVSRITHIALPTIRNWEQRYGIVVGSRGSGGHRLYSQEQVEQLLFIQQQIEAGLRSSDAHRLLRARINLAAEEASGTHSTQRLQESVQTLEPATFAGVPLDTYGHAAALVTSSQEERAVVVPFVVDGLRRGEQIFFIHARDRRDEVRGWLGSAGEAAFESGRLRLLDASDTYLPGGEFDAGQMLRQVGDIAAASRAARFPRARFVGQMEWSSAAGIGPALIEYEAQANHVHAQQRTAGVCVYPIDRFPSRTLVEILEVHPVVFMSGRAHVSPFFVPPAN
jgi:DNA-binding transcriptional MerR regulator